MSKLLPKSSDFRMKVNSKHYLQEWVRQVGKETLLKMSENQKDITADYLGITYKELTDIIRDTKEVKHNIAYKIKY